MNGPGPDVPIERRRREHALAVAALVLFTAIVFAPLLSGRSFSMVAAHMFAQYPWLAVVGSDAAIAGRGFPQTDHAETFYPNSVFLTHAVRTRQLPLWFPYSFGGIPLLELGLSGFLYPPRLLLAGLLEPIAQHDGLLVLHLLLAGLGMYGLLRAWGANAVGAVFGGMVWELNGYQAFWLVLEHVVIASAWLPVTLLAATLASQRQSPRWAVAAGLAGGLAAFSGSLLHVYAGVVLLAVTYAIQVGPVAWRLWCRQERRSAAARLALPLCTFAVAAGVSAVCWLPLSGWLTEVHRRPSSIEVQLAGALDPARLARSLVAPDRNPAGKQPDFAVFGYTGVVALLLALGALRRPSLPVVAGAALATLSLGVAFAWRPLIWLLRIVLPGFGAIHPYVGMYLFCFAVALLAAIGITDVARWLASRSADARFVVGCGCAILLVEGWQLVGLAWAINPAQPSRSQWLFPETPLIRILGEVQGAHRILPVSFRPPGGEWSPPVFAGKVAAGFELRSGSGYESLLPSHVVNLWRAVERGGSPASGVPPAYRPYFYHDRLPIGLLEKLSVGLLVTPPGVTPVVAGTADPQGGKSLERVYDGPDGSIHRLTRALPRAFVVPRVQVTPTPEAALRTLVDPSFDARRAAIVVAGEAAAQAARVSPDISPGPLASEASIVSDRLNEVIVDAISSHIAMLVLNDSWAPGWKARVDDAEAPVVRVNYAFRGVVIPPGHHRVVFRYRPGPFLAGAVVSALTALLALVLWMGDGPSVRLGALFRRA